MANIGIASDILVSELIPKLSFQFARSTPASNAHPPTAKTAGPLPYPASSNSGFPSPSPLTPCQNWPATSSESRSALVTASSALLKTTASLASDLTGTSFLMTKPLFCSRTTVLLLSAVFSVFLINFV